MRDPNPPPPAPAPAAATAPAPGRAATRSRKHTRTRDKHTPTRDGRILNLPPTPTVRSARAATIVGWFGLDQAIRQRTQSSSHEARPDPIELPLAPGTITLITGPSGAGKSSLLRDVQQRPDPTAPDARPTTWIDLAAIALPDVPVVDCFHQRDDDIDDDVPVDHDPDRHLRGVLLDLARVGLAEAWTYLRTPAELSEGQRWRLRLALALHAARRAARRRPETRVILLADEFAALLDRVTACVVARSLRRLVARHVALCALVATSHHDLTRALAPDVIVHCDFGRILVGKTPTISSGPAARGVADQAVSKTEDRPHSTPVDPRRRERKNELRGGPMRNIIVTSLATLALCAAAPLRADERRNQPDPALRGGNDRLLLEPRSPFAPPRSLFEFDPRPSRRPIMPLYPTIERELDRGQGRIESDLEFELRQAQREQDERRGVVPRQREFERFEESHDRTLRIQQQERRAARDRAAARRIETESQRLAAERERFYRSAGIDATGAAADAAELRRLERAYQRDVKQLRRDREAELNRLARRDDINDAARRAARAQVEQRYRAAQTERREQYAAERARLLGN